MLAAQNNEAITRTGPGTPMGEYLRRYWIPSLFSRELTEPDGPPLRVRLLCEDLIAFRTTSDEVGLIQNACPHRGASLFFGRNEEDGLRCVYHGWKFDVEGRCVDMPSEPAESNFKTKVTARAYTNAENDYGLDRERQRTVNYTGIENGSIQDAAVQETMGAIFDRTKEHLGTSDAAIIALRNYYLQAVRDILEGAEPWLPRDPAAFRVRSVSALLDQSVPFAEGLKYMAMTHCRFVRKRVAEAALYGSDRPSRYHG